MKVAQAVEYHHFIGHFEDQELSSITKEEVLDFLTQLARC